MKLFILFTIFLFEIFLAPKAFAGRAGDVQGATIESDVVSPVTNSDVRNLDQNGPFFLPGQTVTFHITIRNNDTNTTNNATITDVFPQNLVFSSGPGTYNSVNRELVFTAGNLLPGTSQTFTLTGTVDGSQLEAAQPTCVSNLAYVSVNNQTSQDTSLLCMQGTTPVAVAAAQPNTDPTVQPTPAASQLVQSPQTGANDTVVFSLLPIGLVGLVLRKLAILKKGARSLDRRFE